ncbi:sensor domain-containing protein [Arthrobacter bambusae]|uniref:sensor domain-containing protein n=1 Tax=Arthrobacter bambusae TaxID=1338426 RepID=UPI0027869AFB|nr:EAL domain-containing protein [Arthrobacter bambusae]MDQ0029954.1 diguanylate cyclase (GGDEF)-like protein/PAS domain S-box-containing protein [Arthrobacter bambusae]MDQ0097528.1 diguanylate cyclase (GGDEF)-like protein/PAS domain S-box-containing protein [Arthrobacter bambusae]
MQSLLLDEIGQSVIGMDGQWRITYWNRASERLYGFGSAEVLGAKVTDLGVFGGPEMRERGAAGREIAHRVANGGDWSGELWMRDRSGREFPVHATVSPIRGRHTVPVSVVAISKDITDRKHTEAILRRLSAMVESSGDAIIGADLTGKITSWNAGAFRMLGWSSVEAVGQSYRFLAIRDAGGFGDEVATRIGQGSFVTGLQTRWRCKDGSVIDVELTVSPVYDQDGAQVGASAIARDVTVIQQLKGEAAAERERLLAAQEMAHVGSIEHTIATGEIWHSEEYARIFGLPAGYRATLGSLSELTHPEDRDVVRQVWKSLEDGLESADFEYRIIRPDGQQRWLHSRIRSLDSPDGQSRRFLDTVLDITERKNAAQILEHQARYDALTGLPNRYLITDVLQGLLDQQGSPVVMFVDIDRFKLINDGIGHGAGDTILTILGERLGRAVRDGDTVGRFGGDEFVVVCANLLMRGARTLAERIRGCTKDPFEVEGRRIYLNLSVGIAFARLDDTAESMLRGADAAMYRAKAAGGDSSAVYDARMTGRATGRLDLESDLRLALDRGELGLNYQPIIDLTTEATVGFEALLRWHHSELGLIMPDTFIPIAEETGLIVPIGTWVLQESLRQVQQWRQQLPGAAEVFAAVNISGRQLVAGDFPRVVEAAITGSGIDPSAVNLEITETILMDQPDLPKETLQRLSAIGVGLSIDDFGTGYSSLSYLKWLSARTLKIDRTFVEELGSDPHGATIIELVLGMADSLKLEVIAEGVETSDQLAELRRLGVRLAQGYFWSKPLPPDRITTWLNATTRLPERELTPKAR